MRLRIIDINFTKQQDWLFKLADHDGNEHYIMSESFYRAHNHKSPITKNELDYYDRGQWITALVEEIEDKSVVIKC